MEFKIVHWNVLADSLSDGFPHVNPMYLKWWYRKKLIMKKIKEEDPDIICLAEVDAKHQNIFDDLNYFSFYSKKQSTDNKEGCLVLINLDKFKVKHVTSFLLNHNRSQIALLLQLEHIASNYSFSLVSTHLKAKPGFELIRLDQCSTISSKVGDDDCIFVGDLNDVPDSLCCKYITEERGFKDVYQDSERVYTTCKKREELVCRTIDYIFYRSNRLTFKNLVDSPALDSLPRIGLPSKEYPSDHVLIGTTFTIN